MKTFKNAMMILIGVAGGIAIVLSCGGDDSTLPDAAAGDAMRCDCPQTQPVEQRIRLVSNDGMTVGNETAYLFVGCGVGGAVAVGGTCDSGATAAENLQLKSMATFGDSWECLWLNPNRLVGVDLKVTAICLFPEGTPLPDAGL